MSRVVDDDLAALPEDQRACLTALRALIARRLPDAAECLSYAMPGFRHPGGKMVAGYAAVARHLGLYSHSGGVIPLPGKDATGFKTSKGGVLFTPARPLPKSIVRRNVDLHPAEIAALAKPAAGH